MKKYRVEWIEDVRQFWYADVIANSEEEAIEIIKNEEYREDEDTYLENEVLIKAKCFGINKQATREMNNE